VKSNVYVVVAALAVGADVLNVSLRAVSWAALAVLGARAIRPANDKIVLVAKYTNLVASFLNDLIDFFIFCFRFVLIYTLKLPLSVWAVNTLIHR